MGKRVNPRHGSMQFWPRVRARRAYAKVRAWVKGKEPKLLGFAGYKAGMTHIIMIDNSSTSLTKGAEISCPVTIIECPPIKIASIRFYKKTPYGLTVATDIMAPKLDKELKKKLRIAKLDNTNKLSSMKPEEYEDIRVIVFTQPKFCKFGKKKPDVFEMAIGGSIADKFNYAKDNLGKEVTIQDVFTEGQQLDIHSITTGKGYQGPVKRFGISLKAKKSEKGQRAPGARCGSWKAQGHMMYRVAQAGQMGFQQRTEYNKWLIKIATDPKEVNPSGGFVKYGNVNGTYILIKGSVGGAKKRLIRFNHTIRGRKNIPTEAPTIKNIITASQQGR